MPIAPARAQTSIRPQQNELAAAIVEAMPKLDDRERRLAIAIYRGLAEARPVQLADAAARAELPLPIAAEIVAGWTGVYRNGAGEIIGFWGLALEKTPHRLELGGGREIRTWCAWDPLFIMPLLGTKARVRSDDPLTGEEVSLVVSSGGVEDVEPAQAVVSFRAPDEPWDESVVHSFCHFVLYFSSPELGERWVADHPGTFLLPVQAAFEVGQKVTREVFGLDEG